MNKSPEQYFQEQDFSAEVPHPGNPGEFSEAERAFMEKYLGLETEATLQKLGIQPPSAAAAAVAPDAEAAPDPFVQPVEAALEVSLRQEAELLLVGFYLGNQEFVVPTQAVQEVIRYMPPSRLPKAPNFVAGVINLRGKVTPLIRLRDLLDIPDGGQMLDLFTMVCRRKGLQFGLMIERVHTMYRVPQDAIDWAVETHFGANVEYVAGLVKLQETLVGIISVDKVIETIIKG